VEFVFFLLGVGLAGILAWRALARRGAALTKAEAAARAREQSLAETQQLARIGSFEWEMASGEVRWSDELYRVLDRDPAEFEPSFENYLGGIVEEDRDRVREAIERAVETASTFSHQYRFVGSDGRLRTLHARGEVVTDSSGQPIRVTGTCQDVTERERARSQAVQRADAQAAVAALGELALEGVELGALMRAAVDSVASVLGVEIAAVLQRIEDGLMVRAAVGLGADVVGARVPAGRSSQSGYTLESGQPVVVNDWDRETRFDKSGVLAGAGARSGATVVIGAEAPFGVFGVQSTSRRDFDTDDVNFLQSVAHILATAIERRGIDERIRHEAVHDPLTGLPNRNLFGDRVAQALAHASRNGTTIAVLFLDLDQFKLVNDSFGHEAGDELLRAVAPRISGALRAVDTVARFGGDEFGILIDELEAERSATRAAERIAAALSRPFVLRGREHFVTATIGIAIGDGSEPPEALIRDADAAMYRAKERGRGRYEIFDEVMRAHVIEHLQMENDLRVALERDQLLLHYQPVVSLQTGRIESVEALVRWQHPERGMIAPGQFIPLAEESGLIVALGARVLEQACAAAAGWHAARPDDAPLAISVNLSARQIADPGLLTMIERVLAETGLDPVSLRLEVTESALVEEGETSLGTLNRLKALGIGLVLDDFGTGFSSLGYVKRFPFDALKVDRSFVERICEEPADAAIVRAVTGIAEALSLKVVAEGVETDEQLAAVRELGCQYAQGFYFARPVPAGELLPLLTAGLPVPPSRAHR
jgi:diguanylate cyclase (GGDEF)-like protein